MPNASGEAGARSGKAESRTSRGRGGSTNEEGRARVSRGLQTASCVAVSARHLVQPPGQLRLLARGLVGMDQAARRETVEQGGGLLEGLGRGLGIGGLLNLLDRGLQPGAVCGVAQVALLLLADPLVGTRGVCQNPVLLY